MLDTNRLALAFGAAAIVLWVLCSAFVALVPGPALAMMGHMLHADFQGFGWTLTWAGFFIGLIFWTVWAMIAGWLVAWFYNRFSGASRKGL